MAGTILGAWDSLADKIRSLLRGSTTYSDSYSKARTVSARLSVCMVSASLLLQEGHGLWTLSAEARVGLVCLSMSCAPLQSPGGLGWPAASHQRVCGASF